MDVPRTSDLTSHLRHQADAYQHADALAQGSCCSGAVK